LREHRSGKDADPASKCVQGRPVSFPNVEGLAAPWRVAPRGRFRLGERPAME